MDLILGLALELHVFVYLDNIIVVSRTFNVDLTRLADVSARLRATKLYINSDKCRFGVEKLRYLGYIVDHRSILTDPEEVIAITNCPSPKTVRQVRQFLGVASWYRRFIANFSNCHFTHPPYKKRG